MAGVSYALPQGMKRLNFRTAPGKGGFIRTTLAPIHAQDDLGFDLKDLTKLLLLIFGCLAVARFLVAH
jgi:hypothetical protein